MSSALLRKRKAVLLIAMLMVAETRRIKDDIRVRALSRPSSDKSEILQKSWIPSASPGNDTLSVRSNSDFYGIDLELHALRSEDESLIDATRTADVAEQLVKVKFPAMMDELAAEASTNDQLKLEKCFSSTQPLVLGLIQSIRSGKANTVLDVTDSFSQILAQSDCGLDEDRMDQTESERTIAKYSEQLKIESVSESSDLAKQISADVGKVVAKVDQLNSDRVSLYGDQAMAPMTNVSLEAFLEIHAVKSSGALDDFASLFSPAEGRKDLCPLFHLFRYFVENSVAAVYAHYGGTEEEKGIVRALIGNQLEYLCPAINTGHAILKSVYIAGVPAMLGYGDLNVLAFIAMEVAILYFFVLLMVAGSVPFLLKLWDKFIVKPLASTSKFLQTIAKPETHMIPRLAAKLGSVVTGRGEAVAYALPRLGVGKLSVLMSVLLGMRAVIFASQLGAAVVAYVAAISADATSTSGWDKLAGGLMGLFE